MKNKLTQKLTGAFLIVTGIGMAGCATQQQTTRTEYGDCVVIPSSQQEEGAACLSAYQDGFLVVSQKAADLGIQAGVKQEMNEDYLANEIRRAEAYNIGTSRYKTCLAPPEAQAIELAGNNCVHLKHKGLLTVASR